MQIYKILSLLLEYPDQELLDNLPELRELTDRSTEIDAGEKAAMRRFFDFLTSRPLIDLQTDYVKTFDFTPEHSLHLTHHMFDDDSDRNRGPALIDLGEMFKEYGVKTVTNELPDYLPLILEFVAYLDENEATVFLNDAQKVICMLADNLTKAESPYAAPLSIIKNRATLTRLTA